jgi:2-amino-4-hydroxy-6-hydroxymethyldihydropteridine diphosphokinase / dihydropteroate synthase
MKCYIGIGSNLGDRSLNLEKAASKVRILCESSDFRASPVYQTKAHVPTDAPDEWNLPFLNAVIETDWEGTPRDFLKALKEIEASLGRAPSPRWSPRIIDLDILAMGDDVYNESDFELPHPGLWDRSFVLDPLKDLSPNLRIPKKEGTILNRARSLPEHSPLWMGILNITPDSFSDGGKLDDLKDFEAKVSDFEEAGVQIFDLGAESTRPGAEPVPPDEEWRRLKPKLEYLKEKFHGKIFRPQISIDTRSAIVAEKAIEAGADWINDVSGLADPAMLSILKRSTCCYVLTHSLSVPPNKNLTLPNDCDPVATIKQWALAKFEILETSGVHLDRIVFDPGIGFGKTSHQSLTILRRLEELVSLPVRLLIGHSRKSFMNVWDRHSSQERDWESVGISLSLVTQGVDVLRVHEPSFHVRAHRAWAEVNA